MNNGPTKKQKSNSGEPVATYGPTWLNTKDAIAMAAGLPVDIFFDLLKKLSFKNMSVYLIEMIRQHPENRKGSSIPMTFLIILGPKSHRQTGSLLLF